MGTQAACSISLPDQPMDCCISSTSPLLASALVSGQVLVHRYEPSSSQQQQQQQDSEDEYAAACSTSYSATQVVSRESKKGASCRAITFTSDGSQLACGFETGTLLQLDTASGKLLARLSKAHEAGVNRLLAIPEQPSLVAAGDDDGGLCIWDLRSTQQPAMRYSKHTDFITGLAFQEKQQALLAVSGDGTLSVHDLRSYKPLARSEDDADDELLSVAVLKHGKKVVCGSQSGVLAIWSWGYWNDCSDRFPGHPESVDALVKFDEDTLITGSSDGALRVINILPNKLIGVVGEHSEDMPVERLVLAGDRAVLASMSHDSCLKLWDMSILQDDDAGQEDDDAEAADDEEEGALKAAAGVGEQGTVGEAGASGSGAAAAGKRRQRNESNDSDDDDGDAGGASDSDADSSDDDRGSKKKRGKKEKTAMTKGRSKPSKTSNFFADLL